MQAKGKLDETKSNKINPNLDENKRKAKEKPEQTEKEKKEMKTKKQWKGTPKKMDGKRINQKNNLSK